MCGIFAITDNTRASRLTQLGLFALQHRGQESAGIVTSHDGRLLSFSGMGLVSKVFSGAALDNLKGPSAIGHVRYSTARGNHVKNTQPLLFEHVRGSMAVAHNGNLTNSLKLKAELEKRGAIFQSSTDSEVIIHLIARNRGRIEDAIAKSLRRICGAYALIFMTPDKIIGVRDPMGFRPLLLGKVGKSHILASETPAIDLARGRVIREIEPGEMVVIKGGRLKSFKIFPGRNAGAAKHAGGKPGGARCVFEQVYLARPDSIVCGRSVHSARRDMGRALAREMKGLKADAVVPVPDSGFSAALGVSDELKIPLEMGFMRNHYVGRSFISPSQELRELTAELKLAVIKDALKGKTIVLVDDSIVRGTTSRRIIKILRQAGVRRICMAIASPPVISPCYYGIDTPKKEKLIASSHSPKQIRDFLGVDDLHYLSLGSMLEAAGNRDSNGFCDACFTCRYPTALADVSKLNRKV